MSQEGSHRWLNEQLRRIPVPEGLCDRLRAIARLSDDELDAELGKVPTPAGLLDRLRDVVADDELDRKLTQVAVPENLLVNLKNAPADERLDESLRDVPVPQTLFMVARRVPLPRRRWRRVSQLATAVSLLIAIGLPYFLAMLGMISVAYRRPDSLDPVVIVVGEPFFEFVEVGQGVEIELQPDDDSPVGPAAVETEPDFVLTSLDLDLPPDSAEIGFPFSGDGPANLLADVRFLQWDPLEGALGAPSRLGDESPNLVNLAPPIERGISAPITPNYDLKFLLKHKAHPIVAPTSPELALSQVPLSTDTTAFDRAADEAARNRLPVAADIRVEEFLAAMDYGFSPAKPGDLGIRTAAGPSVFGASGAQLLQVAVQAGRFLDRQREPMHLTVAVDTSASMGSQGRLDAVRKALDGLMAQLGPHDRLTLASFAEESYMLLEDATVADEADVQRAASRLRAQGATGLAEGVRLAMASAIRAKLDANIRSSLVIITDGAADLSEQQFTAVREMLQDGSRHGVELTIVDLGSPGGDPILSRLADAAQGRCVAAVEPSRLKWMLLGCATDASSMVAADVELRVRFNPDAVAAYRLIGHAPGAAGMLPGAAAGDLRSLEAATAVYEVWLKPGAGNDVALVELGWRNPSTGEPLTKTQRISRLQFAPSFASSALSLQAAAVVVETAEILAQSYFAASPSGDLAPVLELAREVNPILANRDSFRRFVDFIGQCEHARRWRGRSER